jgi:hypothetical protein
VATTQSTLKSWLEVFVSILSLGNKVKFHNSKFSGNLTEKHTRNEVDSTTLITKQQELLVDGDEKKVKT